MPQSNPRRVATQPRFVGKPRDGEEPPEESAPSRTRIEYLDPNAIRWPAARITSQYDEESTQQLVRSMAEGGQEEALLVRQLEDGSYEGAGGYNRCLAAVRLNWTEVECAIRQGTHRDVIRANLRTALNKRDPNPMSTVRGIAHAYHEEGLTLEDIVADTGYSPAWVEDELVISDAAEIVKQCFEEQRIARGHAVLLAKIEDLEAQETFLALQLKYGFTVSELAAQIRGPDESPEQDTEPEEKPAKTPRTRRATAPVEVTSLDCQFCPARQDEGAKVELLYVCTDCREGFQEPAAEGHVSVPVGLLREAESLLAASQAGNAIAERFAAFLEG